MQLVSDFTADSMGFEMATLPDIRKRATHLSHFLHAHIPWNENGFMLIREEDMHLLTESVKKVSESIVKEAEVTPVSAYANDKSEFEIQEATQVLSDSENIEEKKRLTDTSKTKIPESYGDSSFTKLSSTGSSLIKEFSSTKTENKDTEMSGSGFLDWLREKNRSASESKPLEPEVKETAEARQEEPDTADITPEKSKAEPQAFAEAEEKPKVDRLPEEDEDAEPQASHENGYSVTESKEKLKRLVNESISLGDEVLSETLADLLAQHGHLSQAEKMYQQLGLLFPKKSAYFAQKIENLNKT